MTSVEEEFPKAQLLLQGKRSAEDPDIIEWISKQQIDYGFKGVWITDDWESSKIHAKLILAHAISVFWICDPRNHALKAIQQLQVITMLIEQIDIAIKEDVSPTYLKGTIDSRKMRNILTKCDLVIIGRQK